MMEFFFSKWESYLSKFQRHPFQLIFINGFKYERAYKYERKIFSSNSNSKAIYSSEGNLGFMWAVRVFNSVGFISTFQGR